MTLPHKLSWYDSPEGAREYLEEYEKAHRRLSDRRERRILERFFREMGPLESALDLPSGWGRYLPYLAARCRRVVEADYSGDMLRLGRQLRPQEEAGGRLRASGTRMPFRDQAVDLVFSMRLNHHLADPGERRTHLQEVFRVARRYAVFTYFDAATLKNRLRRLKSRFTGRRPKFTLRLPEVSALAEEAGFAVAAAPLLFFLGSGHRLVLARRRQPA